MNFFGYLIVRDGGTAALVYLKQEMGNISEGYLGFLSLVDVFEPLSPEEVEALGRRARRRTSG